MKAAGVFFVRVDGRGKGGGDRRVWFVEEPEQLNMLFVFCLFGFFFFFFWGGGGLVLWLLVFLPVRSKNTQYYLYLFRPRRDRAVSCLPPVSPSSSWLRRQTPCNQTNSPAAPRCRSAEEGAQEVRLERGMENPVFVPGRRTRPSA